MDKYLSDIDKRIQQSNEKLQKSIDLLEDLKYRINNPPPGLRDATPEEEERILKKLKKISDSLSKRENEPIDKVIKDFFKQNK